MTVASTAFALRVGSLGPDHLQVHSWTGTETIGRPYDLRVSVSTRLSPPAFERAVFGAPATLFARSGSHHAQRHGVVCALRSEGQRLTVGPDRSHFVLRIVPHLWLLSRRKNSQIFQNLPVEAVVAAVLGARGLPHELRLSALGAPRPYCTQYEETDLAFLRRLCAENGWFYFFDHGDVAIDAAIARALDEGPSFHRSMIDVLPADAPLGPPKEKIVITDRAAYDEIEGGPIPFLASGMLAAPHDFVSSFTVEQKIHATAASYRELDWRRPLVPLIGAQTASGEPRADLEVYEHESVDFYPDPDRGRREATRMLAASRRNRHLARGLSNSVRLFAGARFVLEGEGEDDGSFAVTSVIHEAVERREGHEGPAYSNRFECVPADVPYLPARARRRSIQTCLTAVVCGPAGEEIHVNEHGQIKVKFHWDRSLEIFEPSCWLRTMQAWAGPSWGFQFIPRVGMEVVVGFEGGDPDKPIVLGSVFNGVTPMPFQTPPFKTRSGVRTRSTPRSDGYNELSFEDAAGLEQVYLKAQKNYASEIGNDRSANVARDDSLSVGASQRVAVAQARHVTVGGDHEREVRGSLRDRVDGRTFVVRSDVETRITGERREVVGSDRTEVVGDASRVVRGDSVTDLRGNAAVLVGRDGAERSATVRVEGPAQISTSGAIDIASDKEIILRVGASYVRIGEDDIEIASSKVTVRGTDARILLEEGSAKTKVTSVFQVVSDETIALKASVANVMLGSEAQIAGRRVLLNSPENATDDIEVVEPELTTVELVDQDGNPVPYQRYRIVFEDGSEYSGFLDESGRAQIDVEGSGDIFFPDLANPEPA